MSSNNLANWNKKIQLTRLLSFSTILEMGSPGIPCPGIWGLLPDGHALFKK
jgi:hypothetical protein